jgi:HEAT repeat protein
MMNSAIESLPRLTILIISGIFGTCLGDLETGCASALEIADVTTLREEPSAEAWTEEDLIQPPTSSEVPSLIKLLKDSDGTVRRHAASRLSVAGPQAAAALPMLLDLADAPEAETRVIVASALANIAPKDPRVLAALIRLFDDASDRVQRAAVTAMGDIGSAAEAAVPCLIDRVTRDYGRINEYGTLASLAIGTLGEIGPGAKDAVPLLVRVLGDGERTWLARQDAADSLGEIGPAASGAVSGLVSALLLKQAEADNSISELSIIIDGRALGDKTVDIRFSAARALGRIGPTAQQAVPYLTEALSDHGSVSIGEPIDVDHGSRIDEVVWTVRAAAAKSLGQIGPAARPALPRLVSLFAEEAAKETSEINIERLSFSGAVALLDETAQDARRAVAWGLRSTDPYTRGEAAVLLGQIGIREQHDVKSLENAARQDECRHVRSRAGAALRLIDHRSKNSGKGE